MIQNRVRVPAPAPLVLATVAAVVLLAAWQQRAVGPPREEAYRANNLGVTYLEQFDFQAAEAAFRQALDLDPQLALARLNLGIALFYAGDAEGARREVTAAQPALPDRAQPDYMLGLISRADDRTAEALEAFARVTARDPDDPGTAVNVGHLHAQERRYPEAVVAFRRALAAEPYNATATYGLATALLRGGNASEGEAVMERFQRLQAGAYATTYSQTYLEQGRYAEAIASTGAEPDLVDPTPPEVTFADASRAPGGSDSPASAADPSVMLFDLDADDDLDLAESTAAGVQLSRNESGRFVPITGALPAAAAGAGATAAVPGDYDNDGRIDLAVLGMTGVLLFRQTPAGTFSDVTTAAGLAAPAAPVRSAAWLDADHDGDLDLFVAFDAGAGTRLWRNNGNGAFTDVTGAAELGVSRSIVAAVPTDFDNRRDIDLLLVAGDGTSLLFRNLRDGSFRDVAAETGLRHDSDAVMAAIGDVNKDGAPDFFIARRNAVGALALSDGRDRFTMATAPPETAGARAAQFIDYDNDGLLDLFLLTDRGPRLLRGLGREWFDVTSRAVPPAMATALAGATSLATGDIDGDGDTDIVARGAAGLGIWRNEGGSRQRSLGVSLRALVSNRSAVGARIEVRAGSLRQQLATYAAAPAPAPADLRFGLGARPGADVVRVLWPSGILQAETGGEPAGRLLAGSFTIEELNRKPSSCPYLYTWNGDRFEFITDFLGGGEMGYWLAPGLRNTPDPDEYVRIDGSQLRPRNGRYELRITNELEEVMFLDRAELVAIAHPATVTVHPNEGLMPAPQPFTLHASEQLGPPVAARDDRGDVLDRLAQVDRQYVDGFAVERIRGYAAPHALSLTLPPAGPAGRRLLLLTGWTDYAFSNDNVAAHQAGMPLLPPSLEFRDTDGIWRMASEDIGIPVGRPQTIVVDLEGLVPPSATEVRIRTSMRIYWDRALVDTSHGRAPYTIDRLLPVRADLAWRGYSAEAPPDGREPYTYNYARVSARSPWKLMPGRYTREGDVLELLTRTDDRFVVSRTGDEVAVSFDATALPALPEGWTRTFLLYADGFSKEMNLHSASPDQVSPLPFHGMSRYPYSLPEAYPSTAAHREYIERYNTRLVPRAIPSLDAVRVNRR